MAFIGELAYEKIDKTSSLGLQKYQLTKALAYENDKVRKNYRVVAAAGFETDFASIPKVFFLFKPKDPRWARAAVIHDKACGLARAKKITMHEADLYLYYAMVECGAGRLLSGYFWAWVRARHLIVR